MHFQLPQKHVFCSNPSSRVGLAKKKKNGHLPHLTTDQINISVNDVFFVVSGEAVSFHCRGFFLFEGWVGGGRNK